MTIVEGYTKCPSATSSSFFVETAIDGQRQGADNTEVSKYMGGKVSWGKKIVKTFNALESATPTIISLTMYKKNLLHYGFHIVGTTHLALTDLVGILDKPAVKGKTLLNMKKHHLMPSYLVLELQLRTCDRAVRSGSPLGLRPLPGVYDVQEVEKTASCDVESTGAPIVEPIKIASSPRALDAQLKAAKQQPNSFTIIFPLLVLALLMGSIYSTYQLLA
jgi:hypothetical protein